jgi:RNA polymerase sigma-70 factor (ECF subfamily)
MSTGRKRLDAPEEAWAGLMRAAQQGDSGAYERLLREVLPVVRRLVAARLGDPSAIEDVVQNVFLSVHRARHTYQAQRPFGPWLRAIARNAVIDAQRQRTTRLGREQPLLDEDQLADTRETIDPNEPLSPRLTEALESLPAAQREAVELIHVRELSVAEAAERAGTTPGALKVRAHRGYRALRRYLGASE